MTTTSPTATRSIDDITADLRAEYDEQIRGLQAAVAKLAAERDREHTRADGLHAANLALVADHIRRQDQLAAAAKTWRGIAARRQEQLAKAHAEIRDRDNTCWTMRDQLNRVADENRDLRTELANQPKPRFRRRGR